MKKSTRKKPPIQVAQAVSSLEPLTNQPDTLLDLDISQSDSLSLQAVNEGFNKSNPYASARINENTRRRIYAASLKLKQQARIKNYKLSELMYDENKMISALDEFDILCFDLDLYPLEHLLAVWLNCTLSELDAVKSAARTSKSGRILRNHSDYTVGLISQNALLSDKPPVFSMYYLKTAYKMYDIPTEQTLNINTQSVSRFDVSTETLTANAQIFSTLADNGERK